MTTQIQRSFRSDLFYAGLGIGAGVAFVLILQVVWQLSVGALGAPGGGVASVSLVAEAKTMGLPLAEGAKAYWYFARSGGIVAYFLLWLATAWGVLMSGKLTKGQFAFGLHEFLPILAMVFAVIHAVALLGDTYIAFSWWQLLLPFSTSYRPVATGLGVLSLYLSMALIASFYLRKWIGRRAWRLFHYATYLAFTLALVHGLLAGTDSRLPAMQILYYGTGLSIVFFTCYRVLTIKADVRRKASSQPGSVNLRRDASQLATAPVVSNSAQQRFQTATARRQTGEAPGDSVL
ncbi:MAG: hypothetical protein IPK16_27325 [Anaerolineales bacterium]|nr:hypothetical protein [Anaerolineales bacterium]